MPKLYQFTNRDRSVLIHTAIPPRPWMNYLWNQDGYQCSVNQSGGGDSLHMTERLDLNRITGGSERLLYLRDDDSRVAWNPGFAPLFTPLDEFVCEHNLAYSEIRSLKDGIAADWMLFVPARGRHEVWRVRLANRSGKTRHLSVFPLVHFSLSGYPTPRYFAGYPRAYPEPDINGIFCHTDNPHAPHKYYKGYLACSQKIFAADGYLKAFLGDGNSTAHPQVILNGGDCTNSTSLLYYTGAVLQNKVTLQPGEQIELLYVLGICADKEEARQTITDVFQPGALQQAMSESQAQWESIISHCDIQTPDARTNAVMNVWAKKQMLYCGVGKKGVRDNMQVADGVLQIWPEGGRAEILDVLAHQYQDGHTVLTWFPFDDTYYSDQPVWLAMGVTGYIKETGDTSILEEMVPYQDGGQGTVWEHLLAGLNLKLTDTGPNGICRIRYADWNDALNIWTDPDAESVMVSEGLGYMLVEMAGLAEHIGKADFAAECRENHARLVKLLNEVAWTGKYYARAFHKGGIVGGPQSKGSKIYANSQSWAILGDVVPPEQLETMLRSMDESLEHEFGMPINWPPYTEYDSTLGRMSGFPPGMYENGGVYCHATGFAIVANAKAGRGAAAFRLLNKIMPDHPDNPVERSMAEPFVFTNCYFTHPEMYGKSLGSWMTGTSAWTFKGLVEWICGVRRGYDGLELDPCLPPDWKEVRVKRTYRGSTYDIRILNLQGAGKGSLKVSVDGTSITGHTLPIFGDGKTHAVEVEIFEG